MPLREVLSTMTVTERDAWLLKWKEDRAQPTTDQWYIMQLTAWVRALTLGLVSGPKVTMKDLILSFIVRGEKRKKPIDPNYVENKSQLAKVVWSQRSKGQMKKVTGVPFPKLPDCLKQR